MAKDLSKRIMVRVTEEQLAWIGQMAADEGVDNATLVRMIVDRLSKGRAPLIAMMAAERSQGFEIAEKWARSTNPMLSGAEFRRFNQAQSFVPTGSDLGSADINAVRSAMAREPEHEPDYSANDAGAATPLRLVDRATFNPGRQ